MRRLASALALAGILVTACTGPSSDAAPRAAPTGTAGDELGGTLTVFAAASLTDVFTELGDRLMAEHPGLDVRFNFAGSSGLAAQIGQGAPADVFASADEAQMAKVTDAGRAEDAEVFARNPLMLAAPVGNPAGIELPADERDPGLADLIDEDVVLAVCAPEVPCGAAAAEVLDRAGLSAAPDTYEDDVRAVLTKVQLGEVDAGLVYLSDVHAAAEGSVLAFGFREAQLAINDYPIAVLADAGNPAAAEAFVELVLSDAGQRVLAEAAFLPPG
jgi:molybdate transport system substrate-binding protein